MIPSRRHVAGACALALLLAGCGGSDDPAAAPPVATQPTAPVAQPARAEVLATASGGIDSIVFGGDTAWLSLSNTATTDTAVVRASLPLRADSAWSGVALGECGLAREDSGTWPLRAPSLRMLGSDLWLFQPWYDKGPDARPEHALCALSADRTTFVPRDAGLKACVGSVCTTLSMDELKRVDDRLYSNAGGGQNVLASNDGGAHWRVLTGFFDQDICTHPAFEIVGDRLLVGGECPLDSAFLRAYQLAADGVSLASRAALPVALPELENRNVQFIQATGAQRVFAGVEGGLLRSEDGGKSFKFVIQHPLSGGNNYPYIRHLLALAGKPDTLVAGGFDKATQKPYLAWSKDGGTTWTDLSALLPGYARDLDDASVAEVTAIAQDPQGRVLVTVNESKSAQGRLVLVTLGTP
jgi:hypothetical protein